MLILPEYNGVNGNNNKHNVTTGGGITQMNPCMLQTEGGKGKKHQGLSSTSYMAKPPFSLVG